jgi:hypothetical protein
MHALYTPHRFFFFFFLIRLTVCFGDSFIELQYANIYRSCSDGVYVSTRNESENVTAGFPCNQLQAKSQRIWGAPRIQTPELALPVLTGDFILLS